MAEQSHSRIYLFGLNHEHAPLELRERVAFRPEEVCRGSHLLEAGMEEVVLVSTCNRTEVYVLSSLGLTETQTKVFQFLEDCKGPLPQEVFYIKEEGEAVTHLFYVASGLNSLILGETQILGQVKQALAQAKAEGLAEEVLTKLFEKAIRTGKLVRSRTRLSEGALSVPYAAAELAKKIFGQLGGKRGLLIGAGETAELAALYLRKQGISEIWVANRTLSRAEELASKVHGRALPLSEVVSSLASVEVVIGAVHAEQFLLSREHLTSFSPRPYLLIDLGVPRNFDPSLGEEDHIFLYTVDELQQVVQKNLERRRQEIPKAEKVVREEVEKFLQWKRGLLAKPIIQSLQRQWEEIRRQELERYRHKFSEEDWPLVEELTHRLLHKLLHLPLTQLNRYGRSGDVAKLRVVCQLFQIEDPSDETNR